MIWQDIVIAICQLLVVFAILPSILSDQKPAFSTNALNTLLIGTIATCLLTLELWFASATAYAIAAEWLILAFQTAQLKKKEPLRTR